MILGVVKGSFDIIIKETKLVVRKENTKIPFPIDVVKKGVSVYYLMIILAMKDHVDNGRILFRNEEAIPDKKIVLSWFRKEALRSQLSLDGSF